MKTERSIQLVPDLGYLRTYTRSLFRDDMQAGITVAVFAVPQVMAYAMLAGLPPVYGLYTVVVAALIGGLWGWSPFISTGPSNSAALLTAAAIAPFAGQGDPVQVVFAFALIVGIIRLAFGLLRTGWLVDYVPVAVMVSFTAGIGTLIALGQFHHLLGVPVESHHWLPSKLYEIAVQVPQANPGAVGIGVAMMIVMFAGTRLSRRVPVALFGIVVCTLLAEALANTVAVSRVGDISEVAAGLPRFRVHAVDPAQVVRLVPFAVAVAVIGLVEASTISRFFAEKHGIAVNDNQEFVGQGLAQTISALFQGIPTSGSFSRSTLMESAGVRTRMGNLVCGACLVVVLPLVAPLLNYIPIACLAGLLFFIGVRLISLGRLRELIQSSRTVAATVVVTILVTVLVRIEYGIVAGLVAWYLPGWMKRDRSS